LSGITGETVAATASLAFQLQPYEILVFDLWPQGATIPAEPLSASAGTPETFGAWAHQQGIAISNAAGSRLEDAFAADRDGDGIANGIEYAFEGEAPLKMLVVDDEAVAEMRDQAGATRDSVNTSLQASADLLDWSLPLDAQAGAPAGKSWWQSGDGPAAFFRVVGKLR
jgi:hypothetical protein